MTDDLELARDRWACCRHCVHGPGHVHDRPCLLGCNDAEVDVCEEAIIHRSIMRMLG